VTLVDDPASRNPLDEPRVAITAFPSPTTTRFLVILAAVIAAGLFVGDSIYLSINGRTYFEVWQQCRASVPDVDATLDSARLAETLSVEAARNECMGIVENPRAWYALGAAGIAMLAGVVALFMVPVALESRRRLRRIDASPVAGADLRVRELASQTQLRRSPTVMLGQREQVDGFSYGSPLDYRIALPPAIAVRWKQSALFDPVVFHELAHLEGRDVGYSWLTRGAVYAIAPIMAIPLVFSLISNQYAEAANYAWRAAVLGATIYLIASQLLRSREFDADLRAATYMGGPAPIIDLMRAIPERSRSTVARLLAYHPLPSTRTIVLTHPHLAAQVRFLDGFAPAFLAAGAVPVFDSTLVSLGKANALNPLTHVLAYGVSGTLLGVTVGLSVTRAAVLSRAVAARPYRWRCALGVATGLVAGEVVGLSATASSGWAPAELLRLMIPFVGGLSVVAMAFAIAEVCTDAAPRLPSPRWVWVPAVIVMSVTFGAVLFMSYILQAVVDIRGGWTMIGLAGQMPLVKPALAGIVLITAAANVLAVRGHGHPSWAFDAPTIERVRWTARTGSTWASVLVGVACAAAALLTYTYYRHRHVVLLTPDGLNELFYVTEAFAVVAAAAAVFSLVAFGPRRGAAFAALTGAITIILFMAGMGAFLPPHHRLGILAGAQLAWQLSDDCAGVLLVLAFAIAPLTLLPLPWRGGTGRTTLLAAALTLAPCALMATHL
jgi:Zn-dependent protease with chaperone function